LSLTLKRLLEKYTVKEGHFFFQKGTEAGYYRDGYRYMMVEGKAYPCHHLVWLIHHGHLPPKGMDIDHKDMNRSNNRIGNLRLSTRSQNMMNMPAHKDSKSGIKGVVWRADTKKWSVRVTANGEYKSFGSYEDLELAELVANEAREHYHGEFARHL
jgi:hypothetical protein